MPAAMERALKRVAKKKGFGKERTDRFVYGAMRKTGWKPSHQMSIPNERLTRLTAIDKNLDSIVQFQYYEDPDEPSPRKKLGLVTAGGLVGAGGVLGHQAVQRTGGYAANVGAAKVASKFGPDLLAKATGQAFSPGRAAGSALWKLKNLAKPLLGRVGLEAFAEPIRMDATLHEPFQGSAFKSKIEQLRFPSGLSPLAAMRLPFPKLMALLNRPQQLRQVFSKKHEKLIELNAKLDEIQFQPPEDEEDRRWRKDRSGKTIKGGIVATAGLAGGYATGKAIQAAHPIVRAKVGMAAAGKAGERFTSRQQGARLLQYLKPDVARFAGIRPQGGLTRLKRQVTSGLKAARYARLSASIDNLVELKVPPQFLAKAKKKAVDNEKEKPKKKGRVSHGGGT